MSRAFKGYASAYSAEQFQPRRVKRFQSRSVSVDFNGAMDTGRAIDEVTWECTSPWITLMGSPAIAADFRSVSVPVDFNYPGIGQIKATVTLDDGAVLNYEFGFTVTDAPIYPTATYSMASGPYSVTATVP